LVWIWRGEIILFDYIKIYAQNIFLQFD
jgi:hypothetical protein